MSNVVIITYVNYVGTIVSTALPSWHELFEDGINFYYPENFTILRSDEEGITWMRGYFATDSKESEGMKVAHALERKSVYPQWIKVGDKYIPVF